MNPNQSSPPFPKPGQLTVPRNSSRSHSMPASSRISRFMQATTSSSGSSLPPRPLYLPRCWSPGRALRWMSSTRRPSGENTYPSVARIGVYGMALLDARGVPPLGQDAFHRFHVAQLDGLAAGESALEGFEQVLPHVAGRLGPLIPDPAALLAAEERPPAGKPLGLDEPAIAGLGVFVVPLDFHESVVKGSVGPMALLENGYPRSRSMNRWRSGSGGICQNSSLTESG